MMTMDEIERRREWDSQRWDIERWERKKGEKLENESWKIKDAEGLEDQYGLNRSANGANQRGREQFEVLVLLLQSTTISLLSSSQKYLKPPL